MAESDAVNAVVATDGADVSDEEKLVRLCLDKKVDKKCVDELLKLGYTCLEP